MSPRSNPFSTRFTRPGAIPFLFEEPLTAEFIIHRFNANNWLAQIVGPHGSGKTTLVRGLEPELRTRFANIKYLTIPKVREATQHWLGVCRIQRLQLQQTRLAGGRWHRIFNAIESLVVKILVPKKQDGATRDGPSARRWFAYDCHASSRHRARS